MESVKLTLRYSGKDVDDGTIAINDLVLALQGFASAYDKILNNKGIETRHVLKLTNMSKGSVDLFINAYELLPDSITLQGIGVGGAVVIINIIQTLGWVIKVIKHIQNKPFTINVEGDNNVIIMNNKKVELKVPQEIYNIYKQDLLTNDINKIASPIQKDKIDSGSIYYEENGEKKEVGSITYKEKTFFESKNTENIIH